jgi:hypothetical protein
MWRRRASVLSRRPFGAAGYLALRTQDFILGYFRFLPTGGMTAAPTAASNSRRGTIAVDAAST